jgi:hypothetical protein
MFLSEAETPLFAAIRTRNTRLVEILLDKGGSVNITSPHSGTPLHVAVEIAHPEITGMLLNRGADMNALAPYNGLRGTDGKYAPLHLIAADTAENVVPRKRIVKMFIDKGADVNIREPVSGQTPLHLAVQYRQFEIMELLIAGGADVNARETGGYGDATPLYYALESGNKDFEKYLRAHGAKSDGSRTTIAEENSISREKIKEVVNGSLTLGIPLAYLGGSIFLYERRFKDNRGSNMMGTLNAYAGSTFACASLGFMIGYAITPRGSGFLGGLDSLFGGFVGGLIGIPVGIAVAHFTHLPHYAKRNRALYYGAPAASMAIPLIVFSSNF